MGNKKSKIAAVLAFCALISLPAGKVQDVYAVDLSKNCSLTVSPGTLEGIEDADIVIDLYKVAEAVPEKGYDAYTWKAIAPYTSLNEGLHHMEGLENGGYRELAQQAAAITLTGTETVKKAADGMTVKDPISGLDSGLYLLIARGRDLEKYVTAVEDEEGRSSLATIAETSDHVYTFLPELIALPTKEADEGGGISTANPGAWITDLEVMLKPEQSDRFGSLEILKTLRTYETRDPASFVFQIDAYRDETRTELLYSDVASVTFTDAGQKSIVLENVIPMGAFVEVTEVYSGAVYTLTTDRTQTAVISAEEIASVAFTNDYDDTNKGGGAVMNHFTYDAGAGWGWIQE